MEAKYKNGQRVWLLEHKVYPYFAVGCIGTRVEQSRQMTLEGYEGWCYQCEGVQALIPENKVYKTKRECLDVARQLKREYRERWRH